MILLLIKKAFYYKSVDGGYDVDGYWRYLSKTMMIRK